MMLQPTFGIKTRIALILIACVLAIEPNVHADPDSSGAIDTYYNSRRFDRSLEGLTLSEIWARGRARAEREFRDGWVELDNSDQFQIKGHFSADVGIYYRPHMFMTARTNVEAHGHNDRVRQLIEEHGPPLRAKELRERFLRLTKLVANRSTFDWISFPPFDGKKHAKATVRAGEFTVEANVKYRESNITDNDRSSTIVVIRDSEDVASIPTYNRTPSAVALLSDLSILAVRFQPPHSSMEFIDLDNARIMWDGRHIPATLRQEPKIKWSINGADAGTLDSVVDVRSFSMYPQFDAKTDAEIMQMGFDRAEKEYREGHVEHEMFGLVIGEVNVDSALGIPYNERGCVVTREQEIESDAYNERITKLIVENGAPGSSADLATRFAAIMKINEAREELDWTPLPPPTTGEYAKTTALGPYHVSLMKTSRQSARESSNAGSAVEQRETSVTELQICRGTEAVATHRIYGDPPTKMALLSDLDVMVIWIEAQSDSVEYLDLCSGKVMMSDSETSRQLRNIFNYADQDREEPSAQRITSDDSEADRGPLSNTDN